MDAISTALSLIGKKKRAHSAAYSEHLSISSLISVKVHYSDRFYKSLEMKSDLTIRALNKCL